MQTAVQFIEKKLDNLLELYTSEWKKVNEVLEQAKQIEKQQIIDAWEDGAQTEHRAKISGKADSDSFHYYNYTYGSSDHIVDTNKMISSQTEISDEEINIGAINFCTKNIDTEVMHWSDIFEYACKWYREQIKQRQ